MSYMEWLATAFVVSQTVYCGIAVYRDIVLLKRKDEHDQWTYARAVLIGNAETAREEAKYYREQYLALKDPTP